MYARILVPLDGSPLAEQVLTYVKPLSKTIGCPIDLISVLEPIPAELGEPSAALYLDDLMATQRGEAEGYMERTSTQLQEQGFTVTQRIADGPAGNVIAEEADRVPDTLVAMATHGRSGVGRWVLGSVADRVLHATKAPMLLIRPNEDATKDSGQFRKVIVPLDGSDRSEAALAHAVTLAKACDAPVTLVQAVNTVVYAYGALEMPTIDLDEVYEASEEAAQANIDEHAKALKAQGVTVDTVVERGSASNVILELVQNQPDDLVVMTTHGRSGPTRWVLGSIADRVVRHAGGPVLIIRSGS